MVHKTRGFVLLTILSSWLIWAPLVLQTLGYIPIKVPLSGLKLIGALTPMVFGLILTRYYEGKNALKVLVKNSLTKGVSVKWLLVVVGTFFGVNLLARTIFSFYTDTLPVSDVVVGPASLVIFTFAVFLVGGGLGEEIGWRGYLTKQLLVTDKPIIVIGKVSAIWTIWHLPLFFIAGTNRSQISFIRFAIPVVALTVMVTWLYCKTNSVLLCALFHTFGNVAHEVFKIIPTENADNPLGFTIFTVIMMIMACLIVIFDTSLYQHPGPIKPIKLKG